MKYGFWIFMFIVDLLIPLLMLVFGWVLLKKPPKQINGIYGYRTARSMKNMDTWNFAHAYCGKLWSKIGGLMFPISMILMLFLKDKDSDTIGLWGGILIAIQTLVLIIAIFPVAHALKKNFDKDGNRVK